MTSINFINLSNLPVCIKYNIQGIDNIIKIDNIIDSGEKVKLSSIDGKYVVHSNFLDNILSYKWIAAKLPNNYTVAIITKNNENNNIQMNDYIEDTFSITCDEDNYSFKLI
jgi:hypothetical protein